MVKNLPSSARGTDSIPGPGTEIPHAVGQLSPRAISTEPTYRRAQEPQLERSPWAFRRACELQPKLQHAAAKTQYNQINKYF